MLVEICYIEVLQNEWAFRSGYIFMNIYSDKTNAGNEHNLLAVCADDKKNLEALVSIVKGNTQ